MRRPAITVSLALLVVAVPFRAGNEREPERMCEPGASVVRVGEGAGRHVVPLAAAREQLVESREARLARRLGLQRGGESATARLLASYSADELALFSSFERLTARPGPPELVELIRRRRAGASAGELASEATRSFGGDPLGRAAVLAWVRTVRVP